jgi:leader peptidase (prepilin peptidase)/N-methyltransferase
VNELPPLAGAFVFAAFGLVVGSFLNVCIYRQPLRQSIVWPASRCAKCQRELSWYENVPVLAWLALRGKCRTCAAPISVIYPVVELVTGGLFAGSYLLYGATPLGFVRIAFGCAMIVLFVIDLQHRILPNAITVTGIPIGFALSFSCRRGGAESLIGVRVGRRRLWGSASSLPAARHRRARDGRREDAGDDRRLPGWRLTLVTLILPRSAAPAGGRCWRLAAAA